jgi:hypothetical protein
MSVGSDESHFFNINRKFFDTVEIVANDLDSIKEHSIDIYRSVCYRYGKIVPNSAFLVCEFGIQNLGVGQAKWARLCSNSLV